MKTTIESLNSIASEIEHYASISGASEHTATRFQEIAYYLRAHADAKTVLIGALQEIRRTQPQTVMNGNAKMTDPDHIKGGWNFHFIAREALEKATT